MELHLQMGHAMLGLSKELIRHWETGTVVLSPRDFRETQLEDASSAIIKAGGTCLFDPQFYLPHSEHARLTQHLHWPSGYDTGQFWSGQEVEKLIKNVITLNDRFACSDMLLPGLYADRIDDDWIAVHDQVVDEASKHNSPKLLATVALSAEVTKSDEQIERLVETIEKWPVHGIYLVCKHPENEYLVSDPAWAANLLDFCAAIKLQGREVVVGYCNQQSLILAASGVDSICSGNFMNVRQFDPGRFDKKQDDGIKQKRTWYYCPHALSEYKIPFLDIAYKRGILDELALAADDESMAFAENLFIGIQPTSVGFGEPDAFRHYLHALRLQALDASRNSFDDTLNGLRERLTSAESRLDRFSNYGVYAQYRGASEMIDASRSALTTLEATHGPRLRRHWSSFSV